MTISFLYTFDYYDLHSLKMLLCSIITIIREFNDKDVHIIIYTTNVEELTAKIHLNCTKILNNIDIRYYDYKKYNQPNKSLDDKIKRFNIIGHSRYLLIKELLHKTKNMVIYMDNDTGVSFDASKYIMDYLKNINKPVLYCKETWVNISELLTFECITVLMQPQAKFGMHDQLNYFLKDLAQMHHYVDINPCTQIFNNGIIICPYNDQSLSFMDDTINIFNLFATKMNSMFNDMIAIGCVCYKYKCFDTIIDLDSMECVRYNKKVINPPPFVHYYYKKDSFCSFANIIELFKIIDNFNNNDILNQGCILPDTSIIKYLVDPFV
jgi:hypothetical protein